MNKLVLSAGLAITLGISISAQAHPVNSGYLTNTKSDNVRTGFGGCWRIGNWSPEKATPECGAPAPVVKAPEPTPAPAPAPAPKMVLKNVTEKHLVLFDFNSTEVGDISDIVDYIGSLDQLNSVELIGHTDRLGSNGYNDVLAAKRVNAVAAALANAGVDSSKIHTSSMGENMPVKACGSRGTALKDCLRANRRVEVNISGKQKVQQ
ncbi:OmpA family protein [Marinobacterium arenosum]|uniref:OmpA family protein n=1 Tax=Marinobacterium arenosum TaxID=2862496 RepID=UPI001C984648|nr:OmpA family protein [Marinobacterium arenosum]MBY4677564.1 OmpA family protein [Marinobacterium arenosum]